MTTTPETFLDRSRRAVRATAARWWAPLGRSPQALLDAVEAHDRRYAIRQTWRTVVREAGLSETQHAASGTYRVEPRIVAVVLGHPERFTIRLGKGQTFETVAAVGRRIATAFEADRIRLTQRRGDQLEIELLHGPAEAAPEPMTRGSRMVYRESLYVREYHLIA